MVDTERPSNVRAIRAMFAEKEKTVIDALKKPKTISYEETNLDGFHPKSSALPLSTNEKICNDSQVTNKLPLASSSTSGTSPSMPLKPPVGPKPVCLKKSTGCLKKSPSVSSNISEFKNIVSQLEGSEGMYTSKSSINSFSNNSPKVSSSQESIKSEENPPPTLLCDNIDSNEGTQSKLIKKERLSLSNISNLESEREFNEVNLRKPSKAPPKPVRHSLISSNNYISKKREYRRKTLPTLEELGPAPSKPIRSSITVTMTNNGAPPLPERNDPTQETIASPPPLPDRILNGNRQLVVPPRPSSGPPKSVPKGPPNRPPPKTPDEPLLDEDLYCDTMDPERAQSLIAEYTEEEECGTRRNSILTRPMNPPPPPPTSQTSNNSMPSTYDDYSHDTQGSSSGQDDIYEEMPCDLNKSPVYSNSKEQEKAEKQRKKDKKEKEKHQKMCEKLRKKYGLTGEEIPVDAGTVKSDCRGSKTDLTVHKGEMVLILRMESNPQGKWLAKNEKGKIGYVDLANIEVDADSVKSVMKVRVSQAIEEDVYSEIQTEDVYECTY